MDAPPFKPTPDEAEEYFRRMLEDGGMEQPDEVEYDLAANELIFLWTEEKLAVILELDGDEPRIRNGARPAPPV